MEGFLASDDFIQFIGDPFLRNDPDPLGCVFDALPCFFFNSKIQLRGKADGPHHPQRIITKCLGRFKWGADDLIFQVFYSVERINEFSIIMLYSD